MCGSLPPGRLIENRVDGPEAALPRGPSGVLPDLVPGHSSRSGQPLVGITVAPVSTYLLAVWSFTALNWLFTAFAPCLLGRHCPRGQSPERPALGRARHRQSPRPG